MCFVLSCTFLKQVFSFTLIHRWQWICFFCHSHKPFLLSFFMTYQLIVNQSNMTDVTSGVGTAHPSKAHEFSPGFSWGTSCFRCLWCAVFCGPLFVFIPPLLGGGGGYTVLPLSICLSGRPSFALFSATIDGRNLIFCHKLHIGTPYCGRRFCTHQIPTSCLPT